MTAEKTRLLLQENNALYGLSRTESAIPVSPVNAEPSVPYYSSGQTVRITISPSFTVTGAESENIEERLRYFADELKDEIIDALEEAGIDAKRSAYV